MGEQGEQLAQALAHLESSERLLVRLRFERGLTLGQVAKLAGLPNAQTADRRIQAILERLRKEFLPWRGKTSPTSV